MNYELAKQLYEAGFLNKDCVDCVLETTLSELIEACGDDFLRLGKIKTGFIAQNLNLINGGNTPEEAVANLWLELNNMKEEEKEKYIPGDLSQVDRGYSLPQTEKLEPIIGYNYMKREIKFRAWDGSKILPPVDLSQPIRYYKWLGTNDMPLMQYTGLKDKNGKEIYEGDIVVEHNPIARKSHYTVEWDDIITGFQPFNDYEKDREGFVLFDTTNCEIIGNIYENLDLL